MGQRVEPVERPSSGARSGPRVLGMACGAALALVAIGGLLRLAPPRNPILGMEPGIKLEQAVALYRGSEPPPGRRVLFVGDSTAMQMDPADGAPARLQASLAADRDGGAIRVVPVVFPGLDPFAYYALADELAALEPDLVILALNLQSLRTSGGAGRGRPELAGWIAPARIPSALRLPLHVEGLTVDRLLLYVSFVRAGLESAWQSVRREQARVGSAWTDFNRAADVAIGGVGARDLRGLIVGRKIERGTAEGARVHRREGALEAYGTILAGLPRSNGPLRMLGAAVDRLTSSGIACLVYVVPVNVERLDAIGLGDHPGWQRSIEVVRENGGELVSFDALVADASFRDPVHFDASGHASLGRALAAPTRAALAARPSGD